MCGSVGLQSFGSCLQCSCRIGQIAMKMLRHPPSKELWRFCMERLRELRGPDTRERDLANILGFEHSRAVRWKEGQMYVDRAEYLVRLADALDVETMLLVAMASGTLTVEQAHRQLAGTRAAKTARRSTPPPAPSRSRSPTDASLFALDRLEVRGQRPRRRPPDRWKWRRAARVRRGAPAATRTSTAWSRPASRSASCLADATAPSWCSWTWASPTSMPSRPAGSSRASPAAPSAAAGWWPGPRRLTDAVEKPALMAGAANVTLFPFASGLFESELDRLEERLGPRKLARSK